VREAALSARRHALRGGLVCIAVREAALSARRHDLRGGLVYFAVREAAFSARRHALRGGLGCRLHCRRAAAIAARPRKRRLRLVRGGNNGFHPAAFFFHVRSSLRLHLLGHHDLAHSFPRLCGRCLAKPQNFSEKFGAKGGQLWQRKTRRRAFADKGIAAGAGNNGAGLFRALWQTCGPICRLGAPNYRRITEINRP